LERLDKECASVDGRHFIWLSFHFTQGRHAADLPTPETKISVPGLSGPSEEIQAAIQVIEIEQSRRLNSTRF
jgi:hypothetical protein